MEGPSSALPPLPGRATVRWISPSDNRWAISGRPSGTTETRQLAERSVTVAALFPTRFQRNRDREEAPRGPKEVTKGFLHLRTKRTFIVET